MEASGRITQVQILLFFLSTSEVVHIASGELPCISGGVADNACELSPVTLVEPKVVIDSETCNQDFPALDFIRAPRVFYPNAQSPTNYTLALIGDVKYLQWLVSNIPACGFYTGDMTNFTQIASYIPPVPLVGQVIYQALIYQQTTILPSGMISLYQRNQFDLENFARVNNLCGPIAGIQFRLHSSFYL